MYNIAWSENLKPVLLGEWQILLDTVKPPAISGIFADDFMGLNGKQIYNFSSTKNTAVIYLFNRKSMHITALSISALIGSF